MLIIKNTDEKDLVLKVPAENGEIPSEITLKNGEEYEVSDKAAKNVLQWNFDAHFDGEKAPSENDAPTDATTNEDLAAAENVSVKNDREFDVEVKFSDADGNEQTATVKSGEEIEVPAEQEEAVKKQIADATEPEKTEDEPASVSAAEKVAETKLSEKMAEERAKIASERAEIAKERAEARYEKLLAEGKITPANRETYLKLAENSAHDTFTVAEGKSGEKNQTKTAFELLNEFIENDRRTVKVGEEKGADLNEKSDSDDVELTDEDKKVGEYFGKTEEETKALKKERN